MRQNEVLWELLDSKSVLIKLLKRTSTPKVIALNKLQVIARNREANWVISSDVRFNNMMFSRFASRISVSHFSQAPVTVFCPFLVTVTNYQNRIRSRFGQEYLISRNFISIVRWKRRDNHTFDSVIDYQSRLVCYC